jgi:hypothetical protein
VGSDRRGDLGNVEIAACDGEHECLRLVDAEGQIVQPARPGPGR